MMSKESKHVRAPWRCDKPDEHGLVRVTDKHGQELLVCETTIAHVIVKAVNWCAKRGIYETSRRT